MSGDLKKSFSKNIYVLVALCLVAFGLWGRFLPHPPNFAPIAAIAIFSGAILPRKLSLIVPLFVIIVSDLLIGLHSTIFWTWGSFALVAFMSSDYLRNKVNFARTAKITLSASILFYVLTNFGVWLQGGLYEPTLNGLLTSYINALPFFRNTLMGDLVYTGLMFGAFFTAKYIAKNYFSINTAKQNNS